MKKLKLNLIVSTGAVIVCIMGAGCSKSKDTGNASGTTGSAAAGGSPETAANADAIQTEPAGPVEMKIKWQAGKRYDQEMSMTQTAHMQVPGAPQPIEQHMTITQDFSISALKQLADGGTELELKFTGLKMSSKMGDQVLMDFDSSKESKEGGDNQAAPLRKMIGAHVSYQLDANGKLVKVEGLDEFFAQMSGGNPQTEAMVKSMMNEETIKQMAQRGQGLPDKPVKVGDQWPVSFDVKAGAVGTMQMKMNYTFKGWQQHNGAKCALLTSTGDISMKPSDNPGPVVVSVEKGDLTGKMWFDPALGMMTDENTDQNVTMKISTQGKSMNSEMQQNVIVKLIKVADISK